MSALVGLARGVLLTTCSRRARLAVLLDNVSNFGVKAGLLISQLAVALACAARKAFAPFGSKRSPT